MRRSARIHIGLMAALSGCATSTPTQGAATPETEAVAVNDQAAVELREHHRHHHHGGLTQFIAMGIDALAADEAKRPQLEKIQAGLHSCLKPAREANRTLLGTLADGVAAGQIDTAKADAQVAAVSTAAAGERECSLGLLNELHQALSPEERSALVDKVEAHFAVWRETNHDAVPGGREKGGRLNELTDELNLTPEQEEKISAALKTSMADLKGRFDPQKAQEHMEAFGNAFVQDSFDAKTLQMNANPQIAGYGAMRMARFYETVTPLLTPEQRTKLAEHLKEHASHQPAVSQR